MKNQTKIERVKTGGIAETAVSTERVESHSEIERIELLAAVTHDEFKDALTMCGVNTIDTGKASAFAIYKSPENIDISEPVLTEPEYKCRFGYDRSCSWNEKTKTDELIDCNSEKYQKLLLEFDQESEALMPRNDVWAYVASFPMGGLEFQGHKAKDVRRPTKAWLQFFAQQEQLRPGFVLGILTNDGNKSGLMLIKNSKGASKVDCHQWECIGNGEGVDRDRILERMNASGMVFADIDLTCPKGKDPSKLYNNRVAKAVETIF